MQIDAAALKFYKELEQNNTRAWFEEHKPRFKNIEAALKTFFNELADTMSAHDELDKVKIFRIYRDVRFSKDKTPFKAHFSGSISRATARLRGGYYLQIKPNESFIATGFWNPNKEDLLRIRKEFEMDTEEIREIINAADFKAVWGDLQGDEVKTAPKGFRKEDPNIDLIRKKQFIFTKKFSDQEVLSPDFMGKVDAAFRTIRPYFDYMSEVLTTDLNGVSLLEDN